MDKTKRKTKQRKINNMAMWQIECGFAMAIIVANDKFDDITQWPLLIKFQTENNFNLNKNYNK